VIGVLFVLSLVLAAEVLLPGLAAAAT